MNTDELSLLTTIISVTVIGYLGYLLFRKVKMPAAGLTGSLFANAVITALGVKWASLPIALNIFLQTIIGVMIGSQFNKEKIKQIKKLALPSLLVGLWMITIGLCIGYLIANISDIDIGTALFSAVPGGMSEMSVLAMMYGLNVPIVVLFQFLRIVMVYFTVPIIAKYLNSKVNEPSEKDVINCTSSELNGNKEYNVILTILIGVLAGYTGWILNIPGGTIIGSLIAVGGLRSSGVKLKALPKKYVVAAQIGLGTTLGITFTPEVAKSLTDMLGMTILFSFIIVLNGLILGFVVHKLFKIDLITSLLACAAAGVSQMSAIALDMDADAVIVSVVQSIRLVAIVLILPPIILIIIG